MAKVLKKSLYILEIILKYLWIKWCIWDFLKKSMRWEGRSIHEQDWPELIMVKMSDGYIRVHFTSLSYFLNTFEGAPYWPSGENSALPVQGTWALSLVREDPTCHGAAKPTDHSYWSPGALEPILCNKRSHHNEQLTPQPESSPHRHNRESPHAARETLYSQTCTHAFKTSHNRDCKEGLYYHSCMCN